MFEFLLDVSNDLRAIKLDITISPAKRYSTYEDWPKFHTISILIAINLAVIVRLFFAIY